MELYTKYVRPVKVFEPAGGVSRVDKAGYVPAIKRIQALVSAGYKLRLARIQDYDFPTEQEIDYTFEDLSRRPGFDAAEASQIMNHLKEKLKDKQKGVVDDKPKAQSESTPKANPS